MENKVFEILCTEKQSEGLAVA